MNRRNFFKLGAKSVTAAALAGGIVVDAKDIKSATGRVNPCNKHIVDWLATYEIDKDRVLARTMSLPQAIWPPPSATWDGRSYTRAYINTDGFSVYYQRAD